MENTMEKTRGCTMNLSYERRASVSPDDTTIIPDQMTAPESPEHLPASFTCSGQYNSNVNRITVVVTDSTGQNTVLPNGTQQILHPLSGGGWSCQFSQLPSTPMNSYYRVKTTFLESDGSTVTQLTAYIVIP
jgi:hypothetical protein